MPTYEYLCKDCNHEVTVFLSSKEFEAKPKIKCLHCQSYNVQEKFLEFTGQEKRKTTMVNSLSGKPVERMIDTGVTLVTRENMNQPEMRELLKPDLARWLE